MEACSAGASKHQCLSSSQVLQTDSESEHANGRGEVASPFSLAHFVRNEPQPPLAVEKLAKLAIREGLLHPYQLP